MYSNQEYISPVFVRPNSDNRWRMKLNLKELNKHVRVFLFQNGDIKECFVATDKPNFFFVCVCVCVFFLLTGPERCIYVSLHVTGSSQENLKFFWQGQRYMFTAFPNGLACCSRLFTKLLKPIFIIMLDFVY